VPGVSDNDEFRVRPGAGEFPRGVQRTTQVEATVDQLVYVPFFSRYDDAGWITSANSAVSVRKMSCTTRKSSADSALRTLLMFGSDRNGFSPSGDTLFLS